MSASFILGKHTCNVIQQRVILVYMLIKGMDINAGAIIRDNVRRSLINQRWRYYYGTIFTGFLW